MSECVSCGRVVSDGVITCEGCAEALGKSMMDGSQVLRRERGGRY